jgi:hypothetical protein
VPSERIRDQQHGTAEAIFRLNALMAPTIIQHEEQCADDVDIDGRKNEYVECAILTILRTSGAIRLSEFRVPDARIHTGEPPIYLSEDISDRNSLTLDNL